MTPIKTKILRIFELLCLLIFFVLTFVYKSDIKPVFITLAIIVALCIDFDIFTD